MSPLDDEGSRANVRVRKARAFSFFCALRVYAQAAFLLESVGFLAVRLNDYTH
jgi:hypothetical protein